MATGPKVARTPLEVLDSRVTTEAPFLMKFWAPGICGFIGFCSVLYTNWALKKPVFSGIHQHVIGIAIGGGIGKLIDDYRKDYLAERDAVLRHYVELHPDDFPPFKHEKFANLFEPWVPIR